MTVGHKVTGPNCGQVGEFTNIASFRSVDPAVTKCALFMEDGQHMVKRDILST